MSNDRKQISQTDCDYRNFHRYPCDVNLGIHYIRRSGMSLPVIHSWLGGAGGIHRNSQSNKTHESSLLRGGVFTDNNILSSVFQSYIPLRMYVRNIRRRLFSINRADLSHL